MSQVRVTESSLEDIADAIRAKLGVQTEYKPGEMAAAIQSIPTGGSAVLEHLSVTENGTYTPGAGVDGFDQVTVNVSGGGDDPFALKNYVQSSGTQYIDTGYVPKANTTVEIVANVTAISSYQILFGCRYAANSRQFWVDRSYSNSVFSEAYGNTYSTLVPSNRFSLFSGNKIFLQKSSVGAFARTASIYTSVSTTHSNVFTEIGLSIYLFALNTNGSVGSYGQFKLYRFRIFEDDTLVHEFIPWEENGVACLKDTVTSEIKYNAGTGDFVYGTDA